MQKGGGVSMAPRTNIINQYFFIYYGIVALLKLGLIPVKITSELLYKIVFCL